MANPPKRKGTRNENKIVALHQALGIDAERVPGSGMFGGKYEHDVRISIAVFDKAVEVKARAHAEGWRTIKKWLGDAPALFLNEDYEDPLVVLSLPTYKKLVLTWKAHAAIVAPPKPEAL